MTVTELQDFMFKQIAAHFRQPEAEKIAITQAVGRVLAEDVLSPIHLPNAHVSAMDGYAFSYQEGLDEMRLVGESAAGHAFSGSVGQGECVRIMTGAVLPTDCDTVVMQEQVQINEHGCVMLTRPIQPAQNIRFMAEEVKMGHKVLQNGRILRDADVLLLAALGISEVLVFRKIRVAVLSTGDELIDPSQPLTNNSQIYDSNRYMLMTRLSHFPVEVIDLKRVEDDLESVMRTLDQAAQTVDVVMTSGGVSVGDYDYLRQAVERIGHIHHYKVAMKPGKPFVFGQMMQAWYFGLPGNPVSGFVGFDMFVQAALWQLCGVKELPKSLRFQAKLSSPVKKSAGRMDIQRANITREYDGTWTAKPCGSQDSHRVLGVSQANAYLLLPLESGDLSVGDVVEVQPFKQAFL